MPKIAINSAVHKYSDNCGCEDCSKTFRCALVILWKLKSPGIKARRAAFDWLSSHPSKRVRPHHGTPHVCITRKEALMKFDISAFPVSKFDSILSRGLSHGLGTKGSQVCIEAAICESMGLKHGDDPGCVAPAVRAFKIALNDSPWSSPKARAKGLRDLGLAQLGSLGVVDDAEFAVRLSKKVITALLPKLFRQVFPNNPKCLEAADRCEKEGTHEAAKAAAEAAEAAAEYAAKAAAKYAAKYAAEAAAKAAAEAAEAAAEYAAKAAAKYAAKYAAIDEYLILVAKLALEVLREMSSPGIALL